MPFVYIILALVLLVVLHELGHFLAAKAVGIRATKFYVFFPPAIFKRTVNDVEYGIGAIPAGGFVKLPGMFEPVPGEVAERLRWEYEDVLPIVTDGDMRLQLDAARRTIAHADSADDLLEPLGDVRDTLARLRDEPARTPEQRKVVDKAHERIVGILDDAHPRAYWRASLWRRMAVIFAGPLVNLIIAFVVLAGFYWLHSPREVLEAPIRVGEIAEDSPAERAGLEDGTRIVGWNGKIDGLTIQEFIKRIEDARGNPSTIEFLDEDGDTVTRTLRPEVLEKGEDPLIGIDLRTSRVTTRVAGHDVTSLGFGVEAAYRQMKFITIENLRRLPLVFFDKEIRDDVGSVVGIVQVADEVDEAGMIIGYVALISLILAVMNLLPLLPLDGGHLLFGLLEALRRGRPMPRAAFERYSVVGMAIVLILFFIGLDNDITRARG